MTGVTLVSYSTGLGLRVVRLPRSVYPFNDSLTCQNDWYFNQYNPGLRPDAVPSPRDCVNRRAVTFDVRGLGGRRPRSLTVSVNGSRQRESRRPRPRVRVTFPRRLAGRRVTVRVVARLGNGETVVDRRVYRLCGRKPGGVAPALALASGRRARAAAGDPRSLGATPVTGDGALIRAFKLPV